jgi:anti-sigma factor RsiW
VGSVNAMQCEKWREAMAMHVFGDLSIEEETGLLAHLEGCAECQVIAAEIAQTFKTLSFVDRAAVESMASVPPALFNRVLGDLHGAGVLQRRRLRVGIAALAGVGAVAAALILVGVFTARPTTSPVQRTVALRGAPSVSASAVLINESWGTKVDLHENGLPGGGVYTVSMKTSSGTWWTAGTYRSVAGEPVDATMACAVSLKKITGIRVLNGAGVTVLTSYGGAPSVSYE